MHLNTVQYLSRGRLVKILETHNLSKHWGGVYAVEKLSIGFEQGKITGIIGPNGSGKSTLTNLLTGIYAIDGGSAVIDGLRLKRLSLTKIPFWNYSYFPGSETF